MAQDAWDRPGKKVADSFFEEGGWEVFENGDKFDLYEIPLYGGDPRDSGSFTTLEDAITEGKTFT